MNSFEELKKLLEQGVSLGLNLQDQIEKVDQVVKSFDSDTIRIVLLGSFSDGKTSVVAGMLGKVLDNMKIDIDESSDELTFYQTDFLGKGFEIVDTPGLFGTKEKEIDGKNVRFSDTTKKYISEAHIVLYVCDAVVPLKASHVPVIKTVLKTFNKLDSTIFVINKMDATGARMKDEDDYNRMACTKKENLGERLKYELGLSDDECNRLNIVCVAADPKGKGLDHWFTKMDDYKLRSHIDKATEMVKQVALTSDKSQLLNETNLAVAKDVALQAIRQVNYQVGPLQKVISKGKEGLNELQDDFTQLKDELQQHRTQAKERILGVKNRLESQIRDASIETIGNIVSTEFGVEGNEATGYILLSRIDSILSECCESNNSSLQMTANKMEKFVETQAGLAREALTKGASWAAKQQVTGQMVLAFRDQFLKGIVKFKPWGAVKLAGNITKWAGRLSGILTVIFVAYDFWKHEDNKKKLQEAKDGLINALNECTKEVLNKLNDDAQYYENFAPSYISMCNQHSEQEQLYNNNMEVLEGYNQYSLTLQKWLKAIGVEDAYFEEITDDVDF
nr:LeoA/HP0731 family dynamin-like GTPase [uncultured Porphyromonas sp.]